MSAQQEPHSYTVDWTDQNNPQVVPADPDAQHAMTPERAGPGQCDGGLRRSYSRNPSSLSGAGSVGTDQIMEFYGRARAAADATITELDLDDWALPGTATGCPCAGPSSICLRTPPGTRVIWTSCVNSSTAPPETTRRPDFDLLHHPPLVPLSIFRGSNRPRT